MVFAECDDLFDSNLDEIFDLYKKYNVAYPQLDDAFRLAVLSGFILHPVPTELFFAPLSTEQHQKIVTMINAAHGRNNVPVRTQTNMPGVRTISEKSANAVYMLTKYNSVLLLLHGLNNFINKQTDRLPSNWREKKYWDDLQDQTGHAISAMSEKSKQFSEVIKNPGQEIKIVTNSKRYTDALTFIDSFMFAKGPFAEMNLGSSRLRADVINRFTNFRAQLAKMANASLLLLDSEQIVELGKVMYNSIGALYGTLARELEADPEFSAEVTSNMHLINSDGVIKSKAALTIILLEQKIKKLYEYDSLSEADEESLEHYKSLRAKLIKLQEANVSARTKFSETLKLELQKLSQELSI